MTAKLDNNSYIKVNYLVNKVQNFGPQLQGAKLTKLPKSIPLLS